MLTAILVTLILILIQITRIGGVICRNQCTTVKSNEIQLGHVISQLRKLNKP